MAPSEHIMTMLIQLRDRGALLSAALCVAVSGDDRLGLHPDRRDRARGREWLERVRVRRDLGRMISTRNARGGHDQSGH